MGNERLKNSLRNLLWGGFNQAIRIIGPFVLRTIMIVQLGNLYLGLNSLFASILQVLNLTELGFSSAVVYCMYKPIAEKDYDQLGKLVAFFKRVYQVIGTIILFLGVILVPLLPNFISGEYPSDVNLTLVYLIYLTNSALGYFFFGYKSSILFAFQRSDVNSNVNSISNILLYAFQITVLLLWKNYYVYVIFLPITTLFSNLLRSYWADKLFPEVKAIGELDNETRQEIWKRVRALLLYKVGSTVSNSADNLVISAFVGLNLLAIYNNYYLIISTLFNILAVYYDSIKASLGNSLVVESVEDNYHLFNNLLFMQAWLVSFCSIMLICLYQPFVELWAGKENLLPNSLVLLLGVYFYSWKIHDIVHIFKDALGLWYEDRFRPLLSSLVNLGLNMILVHSMGLFGVVCSTILSELSVSLLWAPRSLFKNFFHIPLAEYHKKVSRYSAVLILCGTICYWISQKTVSFLSACFGSISVVAFIVLAVLMCIICNFLLFVCNYKCVEFQAAKDTVKSLIQKKRKL